MISCNLCGNTKYTIIYPGNYRGEKEYFISDNKVGLHQEIIKCSRCGLIFVNPDNIDPNNVQKLYQDQPHDNIYSREEQGRCLTFENCLKRIEAITQRPGKMLDIGCASGVFLNISRKRNWEPYGIEPSSEAVNEAKSKYNISVVRGGIESSSFADSSLDAITMFDVIEHTVNPKEIVKFVHGVLKKKGVLLIVTPDINSILSKILKEKWHAILPSHLFYFTKKSLSELLETGGFRIVKTRTHTRNFTLSYLGYRLAGYNKMISSGLTTLSKAKYLRNINFPINFRDEIECYAVKK